MKLGDRIKMFIGFEITLFFVSVISDRFFSGNLFLFGAESIVQICLLLWGIFQILVPMQRLHDVQRQLLKAESMDEVLHGANQDVPGMKEIELLLQRYANQRSRQNLAQMLDKQTALTALQSQINPHFLYNTLDTIRGQALIDENYEIARMVEALSSFFRYSISRKGNLVTLRDELANINNYMLIQRYRFNNRFSLEIIIDEEDKVAYDYLIPRLIIQPVVENAIFHGLEEKMEGGKVSIEVIVTETNLFLMISDNGKGIERAALNALNERIYSNNKGMEDTMTGNQRSTGIALPNIHRRIQLLFGEEYGVHVYSTVGQGTDVEIVVPADYKRKENQKHEERTSPH